MEQKPPSLDTLTALPGRLQAWAFRTFRVEDTMLVLNLALSTKHTTTELARYEAADEWAFALAFSFGVDIGIAFASWVACNTGLKPVVRLIACGWLTGLLCFNYYLNLCHYLAAGAGLAAWGIAAVFPVSMAACGAIKAFRYEGETGVRAVVKLAKAAALKPASVPASTSTVQPSPPKVVTLPAAIATPSNFMLAEHFAANPTNNDRLDANFDYCVMQVVAGKMSGKEAANFTGKSEATISRAVAKARKAQPPMIGVI